MSIGRRSLKLDLSPLGSGAWWLLPSALFFLCLVLCFWAESPALILAPAVLVGLGFALLRFKDLFYLLLFILPFSTEMAISPSLATDFPSEILIVGVTGGLLVLFLAYIHRFSLRMLIHPITVLLSMHLVWIFVTVAFSELHWVSIKYGLAKLWYVVCFFFGAYYFLRDHRDIRRFVVLVSTGLLITCAYTLIRHAGEGFSFLSSNFVMAPFFRNHVNYGAMVTLGLPWLWYWTRGQEGRRRMLGIAAMVFLCICIYFSYLRAAYVCILMLPVAYYVVKWRLMRWAIAATVVVGLWGVNQLLQDERYLELAPNYETTISHSEFDDLLSATTKGEDISTMERLYRWVAAYGMIKDRFWTGFGPGNFYNFYKPYTLKSFRTYVSDNPERSGIHSYYLMVFVEQGLPGFFVVWRIVCGGIALGRDLVSSVYCQRRSRFGDGLCFGGHDGLPVAGDQ